MEWLSLKSKYLIRNGHFKDFFEYKIINSQPWVLERKFICRRRE